MGIWDLFKKGQQEKQNDEKTAEIIKKQPIIEEKFSNEPFEKPQQVNKDTLSSNISNRFFENIPTPSQIDSVSMAPEKIDINRLLISSIPDHKIGSMILSNIFLIPKNVRGYEDSWPVYQENLEQSKKSQIEIEERRIKQEIEELKGKGKKLKKNKLKILNEKRDIIRNYYEDYEKTLSLAIQNISVEILPIENQIKESKYRLNDVKQKIVLLKDKELSKIKEYHNLLESNIRSLTKIKDTIKNVLSLKKIWQATHIVATYIVAFFGATEFVRTNEFKEFIKDKLGKISFIGDLISSNLIIVQGIAAGMLFLVTIGLYDKFVIDYLKRRQIKKEIKQIVQAEEEAQKELDEINQKIAALKEEKNNKLKSMIKKTEHELEFLYEDFKTKMTNLK